MLKAMTAAHFMIRLMTAVHITIFHNITLYTPLKPMKEAHLRMSPYIHPA